MWATAPRYSGRYSRVWHHCVLPVPSRTPNGCKEAYRCQAPVPGLPRLRADQASPACSRGRLRRACRWTAGTGSAPMRCQPTCLMWRPGCCSSSMTRAWRARPPTGACEPRSPAKIPSWPGPAPVSSPTPWRTTATSRRPSPPPAARPPGQGRRRGHPRIPVRLRLPPAARRDRRRGAPRTRHRPGAAHRSRRRGAAARSGRQPALDRLRPGQRPDVPGQHRRHPR